ncbi:MAG: lipopolysaccharide biosynthesis protein [Betaproteobacteria bacterium]|nr:MAG: lipopolysaccharide biosynthesis protein [Betaproteobacteria bacterium]
MTEKPEPSAQHVDSLREKVVRGATWMVALRLCDRLFGLASLFVLARLLVPEDFGVIALVNALIGLLGLMGAFGLETALVRSRDAGKPQFDTVFTFRAMFGLAMALVLAAVAKPAADFYGDPRVTNVVLALACARLIGAFENVGLVYFRKDLAFDKEFRFVFCKRILVTLAVTLPLAFYLRDYRALVAGTLAGSVVGVALSYYLHPYRPSFGLPAWRELFGFSKWMLATNLVGFAYSRAADFIIGRLLGAGALGVFSLSKEISVLPSSELAAPMQRAAFSGYARLSGDVVALRQAYLRVVSVLSSVVIPAGAGLCLLAAPLVHLFLGDRWLDAIPVVQILAVEGILVVGLSSAHYIYLTLGTPQKLTSVLALHAGVSITLMLILIPAHGLVGAATAWIGASVVAMPINLGILSRALQMRGVRIWEATWRPIISTCIMALSVLVLESVWTPGATPIASAAHLAASVALGVATYAAATTWLWWLAGRPDGPERLVIDRARVLLPRRAVRW